MYVCILCVRIQDPAVKNMLKSKFPQVHNILMREHILMSEHILIHMVENKFPQMHYIDHSPLGKANPEENTF
jgi:hypothetical protein